MKRNFGLYKNRLKGFFFNDILKPTYEISPKPNKKDIIILAIPIFVYVMDTFGLIPEIYQGIGINIFIALYSATIGYKYLETYISKVNGKIISTIEATIFIMMASDLLAIIGFLIIGTNDPQQLRNITITGISYNLVGKYILEYIFVGIGEELLCFYILMILLFIIPSKYKIIIGIVMTSLIFGLLHSINWPIISVIPIALSHIPLIYSYIKLKTLIPAMICHMISDILAVFNLIPELKYFIIISNYVIFGGTLAIFVTKRK